MRREKALRILPLLFCILVICICVGYIASETIRQYSASSPVQTVFVSKALPEPDICPITIPARTGIDINSASEEELQILPGIGPSRARAILAFREQYGRFWYPEDLTRVSGIGKTTYQNFRNMISCPLP